MSLITLLDAHIAFGERPLLDGAQLTVQAGERVGLIGRNGTGKSTLLSVLAGNILLDDGRLQRREGLRVALVEQEPQAPPAETLQESLLLRAKTCALWRDGAPADEREHWRLESRLEEFLHRFGLSGVTSPTSSSGGERKRAALALALALQPDLLLLDEPTNHLDIQAIERLEELLLRVPAAVVITHDRAFLDRVTTRIIELDRGVLRSFPGSFAAYEQRKDEELAAEDAARRRFEKFWQQEEAWIRKGVEARRTRNEGRVRRLEQLRLERATRRDRLGNIRFALNAGERSGDLVAEFDGVSKRFADRPLIEGLSMRIMRGDRIGLVGPNGAGKSTLIRLILGELAPDAGTVRLGTRLNIAYFDQLRAQLDPGMTLADAINPGSDWVQLGSERKHIVGYLGEFLFPAQRIKSPISMLSGGERNRLLLARLFAQPANLVILDEPTNDLDIESLELLEERLQSYQGTLLLVTHDRRFLDNVVTQTLAAEKNGVWREYAGGYSDYLQQRQPMPVGRITEADRKPARQAARDRVAGDTPVKTRTRLSYKEERELAALPEEIESLEREQTELTARMSEADYHRLGGERLRADRKRLAELEELLLARFARWESLEEQRARSTPPQL
ncbi:MAG TPA: ATP-binding cassette domain-containing protein [Steroidobacteraceae bacterium]|jgi:ATP-binding cassette subfamily F protein uup|nr:ATP-binding cassette domain-containing protein [Steroidobacteraceae bacterium]